MSTGEFVEIISRMAFKIKAAFGLSVPDIQSLLSLAPVPEVQNQRSLAGFRLFLLVHQGDRQCVSAFTVISHCPTPSHKANTKSPPMK